MYEKFERLSQDKKDRIINSASKIFSKDGFKKAAMDDIVKDAGISKGSIFYYFQNKASFYLYLYDYNSAILREIIYHKDSDYMLETDFFDKFIGVNKAKAKLASFYPYLFDFIKAAYFETAPEITKEIKKRNNEKSLSLMADFCKNIDFSKFKPGIQPKQVMQLVTWIGEGCGNEAFKKTLLEEQEAFYSWESYILIYTEYIELLRKQFYKSEHL